MPPKLGYSNEGQKVNTFNIRLALADSSYFPEIPEIYYNPVLTEGCSYHSETFKPESGFILNDYENISIDKIAILFYSPSTKSDNFTVKRYWKLFDKMIDSGYPDIKPCSKLYKQVCTWNYYFNIQWDCVNTKMSTIRIEFNPNKVDIDKLVVFFSCIKKFSFESSRIGRIDIAIDYGIYLEPFCWFAKNIALDNFYRKNAAIKTIYFGSKQSDNQLRVYDKAEELRKSGIEFDFDLWRVEAEIKDFNGQKMNFNDADLLSEFNPFEKLEYIDTYGFKPNRESQYNLFVYNARVYGVDFAKSFLSRATKYRYLKYLKQDIQNLSFNAPGEIYKHCFRNVYTRFYNKLQELYNKGQELALNLQSV